MKSNKAHYISKAGHVKKHDNWPFPGMCFPFYNCQSAHALHGQRIKNKKG